MLFSFRLHIPCKALQPVKGCLLFSEICQPTNQVSKKAKVPASNAIHPKFIRQRSQEMVDVVRPEDIRRIRTLRTDTF